MPRTTSRPPAARPARAARVDASSASRRPVNSSYLSVGHHARACRLERVRARVPGGGVKGQLWALAIGCGCGVVADTRNHTCVHACSGRAQDAARGSVSRAAQQ